MSVYVPGEEITSTTKTIGPGLYLNPETGLKLTGINAGILTEGKTNFIDFNSKRYIPSVGDFVIGTIVGSFSDSYKVSLQNFSSSVTLSYMAFPNASKKNRPTLKTGDLVYARVARADKELEAEIECVDPTTGKDAGFGHLAGGYVFDVSLGYSRELLFNGDVLESLVNFTQFEVAIGINGRVWIKAEDVQSTLKAYRGLKECEGVAKADIAKTLKRVFEQK